MARPAVDVIVPFAGSSAALEALLSRLERLELGPSDSLTVVDNQPRAGPPAAGGRARLVHDFGRRSPAYARNRGAREAAGEWLLFIDADVDAPPDLLDRYFDRPPGERTAVLAGAVIDEEPANGGRRSPAVRYAHLRGAMSHENTLAHGRWAFAQTANCAVRRAAFEAVGGFRDELRAAEDADLRYRLAARGWEMERRDRAVVRHRSRRTLRELLAQRLVHGSGAAWLNRAYPGSFPPRRWPGLAWWGIRRSARGVAALVAGDRDEALLGLLDPLAVWAFELGRLLPNRARRARRGAGVARVPTQRRAPTTTP